ncbi:activating transcription factor 7-interacting protein 2 isoform X2 [Ranitomeya variabilis]|uniref:activating transcription factor 7-interacting protein 2 isoform X2 n=1 Tax=Ranitomeya variabilis TaxID=490064 RepID=UPI0040567F8D
MEAAVSSNDEAFLVSPSNGPARKKFRARKTMTASCRQQLATLKLKNSSNSETTNKSESTLTEETPVKTVQQPEIICETNFTAQDNPAPGINKSQGVFHNGLKVSIEVSQVDSGINIGCSYNETWEGVSKESEDVPFSHTAHFLVHDFNTDAPENHITAIQQVTASTNTETQGFDEDVKTEGEQTNSTCSAISENLNASITVQIIDEDKSLKTTSSIDVTPAEPPDPDSSSVPEKELDPSNSTAGGSRALTPPSTFDAVSDSDQPMPGSDVAADDSGLEGGCQKKRTCSESSHVPDSKRAKTSANTLDEIQCLIDSRVNKIFEDAFDQRMQALTRQADLIRRNMNHTDDITRHLRSIRRLERHLKYAVNFQKQISSGSTKVTPISSSSEELCSTVEAPSASTVLPPPEVAESLPRTSPAQDPTASSAELVVLSDNESEEPSNPKQSQKEQRKSSSKKVDPAAMQKIMESIKEHRKKAHSSRANKPVKAVIDLTDDEGQKSDKDSTLVSEPCIPNGDLAASATSSKESSVENVFNKYSVDKGPPSSNRNEASGSDVTEDRQSATIPDSSKSKHKSHPSATSSKESSVENIFDKYSVEKGPPSSNRNEASSSDVTEDRQSATIPDSSKSKKPPEAVTAQQTSSTPEPSGLKPPQKPHLRLAQVQNPKGIALSWNVASVDLSCAPAKVYCLYVHQGDPNNPKKLWKKIGEIKALPLPMACTLTQFVDDTTYSFAMRAKDADGRFGPLCDIQSTTLKPASSSKKS